jgi:hypothetical protein
MIELEDFKILCFRLFLLIVYIEFLKILSCPRFLLTNCEVYPFLFWSLEALLSAMSFFILVSCSLEEYFQILFFSCWNLGKNIYLVNEVGSV